MPPQPTGGVGNQEGLKIGRYEGYGRCVPEDHSGRPEPHLRSLRQRFDGDVLPLVGWLRVVGREVEKRESCEEKNEVESNDWRSHGCLRRTEGQSSIPSKCTPPRIAGPCFRISRTTESVGQLRCPRRSAPGSAWVFLQHFSPPRANNGGAGDDRRHASRCENRRCPPQPCATWSGRLARTTRPAMPACSHATSRVAITRPSRSYSAVTDPLCSESAGGCSRTGTMPRMRSKPFSWCWFARPNPFNLQASSVTGSTVWPCGPRTRRSSPRPDVGGAKWRGQ